MVAAHVTQTELAEKTGMTIQTINAFCNGRGKVLSHSLEQMAQALGTTAEELFFEESPPPPAAFPPQDELAEKVARAVVAELVKMQNVSPLLSAAEKGPRFQLQFAAAEESLEKIVELLSIFNPAQMKEALRYVVEMRAQVDTARARKAAKAKQTAG